MPKLIVIADDFTGSNDTGVQLAKKGATVTVSLGNAPLKCDVPVINTESRALSHEHARRNVSQAVDINVSADTRCVFKKIDSTFRGNIGAEIEAATSAFMAKLVVVAAAIPAAGRTTVNGVCLVNGTPVAETEFATDPKTPVTHSHISEILGSQSTLPCINVDLDTIRKNKLETILRDAIDAPETSVVITDAETDADLALVAQVIADIDEKIVLVGAAGIANQLLPNSYRRTSNRPALVLAGSMSDVTQKQIHHCEENGLTTIDVDAQKIWFEREEALAMALTSARKVLGAGRDCAIRTAANQNERTRAMAFCEEQGINGTDLGNCVASFLGDVGKTLMAEQELAGVLFTGGDIAAEVAAKIGAIGYEIKGEVLPCIPYGCFTGSTTTVVTKAGGFGTVEAISQVIKFLRENR
ncbi:four-carbon acid sugar kinase family protein [Vibrio owensii]|uniref:four-carbon acid sugar kinase family protein n=1 Tax=Vibrio owensii TaxID=696485 RepID=UPI0038CED31F